MSKRSPVAIFLAASTLMAANTLQEVSHAGGDKEQRCSYEELISDEKAGTSSSCFGTEIASGKNNMGGLKEWTTDQDIKDKSTLDKAAKKAAKKAKKSNICIPVGEGENCW